MGVKRWNGSAYTDLDIPKVNNVAPKNAFYWTGSRYGLLWPPPIILEDTFDRANTTGAIGGPFGWTKIPNNTNHRIASNCYAVNTTDGQYGIVTNVPLNGDDGYLECVVGGFQAPSSTRQSSMMARVNSTFTSGVSVNIYSGKCYLSIYSGTTSSPGYTDIDDALSTTAASGDVFRLEFVGLDYRVLKNGVEVMSATSSAITPGPTQRYGGLTVQSQPIGVRSGSWNNFKLADWDA